MYIIYNEDGSIRKVNLTDFIQKGNNNVNHIFIGIKGRDNDSWACSVLFTLLDGSITSSTPITTTKTVEGVRYSGWNVSIPADATVYEGSVSLSITVVNLQQQTLFTYKGKLVINPSSAIPNETKITYAQYQSLLELVLQKPAPLQTFLVFDNVLEVDLTQYDDGQIFYDKESNAFYILTNGQLEPYTAIDYSFDFATDQDIDALFNDNSEEED